MKTLTRTKTIEEVYGYEAEDGTVFKTEQECINYEESARAVIEREFRKLMVGGKPFSETYIWEGYGYGSEEYEMAIIDIKDLNDLEIANRYYEIHKGKYEANRNVDHSIDKKYIGQKVLVNLGYEYDSVKDTPPCPRTKEELIEGFKETMEEYFNPKPKEEK